MVINDAYARPIGTAEKLFLVLNEIAVKSFALVAELDSFIESEELKPALSVLSARHSPLKFAIQVDDQHGFWFKTVGGLEIPYETINRQEGNWESIVANHLTRPLNADAALIKVILLQSDRNSTIILIAHHALGDGISVKMALQDLLLILSGEKLPSLPIPSTMDELLSQQLENINMTNTMASDVRRSLQPWRADGAFSGEVFVSSIQLSAALTNSIIKAAHKEHTTVNAILNAACAIAIKQLKNAAGNQPLVLRSPASVRRTFNVGPDFGLYIVTKILALESDSEIDIWKLARHINKELKDITSIPYINTYISGLKAILQSPSTLDVLVNKMKAAPVIDFMVTNLGVSKDAQVGRYTINKIWGPIVVAGNGTEQTIGVSTINNSIFLTQTSMVPLKGLLERLTELFYEAVNQMI